MRLYLLQHALAQPKSTDPDRPLTVEGKTDLDRLARQLVNARIQVARVVHSGKTRAMQSAARIAKYILPHGEMDTSGLLDPDADPAPFAELIDGWEEDTLVVGHLPFVARLADRLLGTDSGPLIDFTPGTLLCLEFTDGRWRVKWMLSPELLQAEE